MAVTVFLDESGCLGWKFDKPYQNGGSSRYLTLAAVLVPDELIPKVERIIRGIYKNRKRSIKSELKYVELSAKERMQFACELQKLKKNYDQIFFLAITVAKKNVNSAFRNHPNGLYNYMVKLLLLSQMSNYPTVHFIPDARSIKIEFKHTLHDYLLTELAVMGAETHLTCMAQESKHSLGLQFADILANIVWSHHEYPVSEPFVKLADCIETQSLFF